MKDRGLLRFLPWLLVALGPSILFGPMLLRREALFWGTPMLQFVPWRQYALGMLRQGHLPLWNPFLGMGAPLLANYQSALLYPPHWLLAFTGPAWGHGLLVALHLAWAGFGMVVWVRRLGMGVLAQIVAGLAFSLSGYLVARGGFLSIVTAAAWVPWIVAACDRLANQASRGSLEGETLRAGLLLAIFLAFEWLAGHAQTAWYTALLGCSWAAWRAFSTARWRGLGRTTWRLAAAGGFAFALSAVQLLPTLEYLLQSHRAASLDPEFAMTYSFWPWRVLGLLAPNLFGCPAWGDYWGYGNYWEDAVYIGVLPLLLALAALLRALRGVGRYVRMSRVLLALGLGAFLLALGNHTPVFPFLFRHVPTFNLFQAPTRWNLILVFCMALLAAIGAQGWKSPSGRGLYWTRLGTAGAGVIGLAAWLGARLVEGVEPSVVRAFALAGVWLTLAGVVSLCRAKTPSRIWTGLAGLVILVDLVIAGWGLNPSVPLTVYQGKSQMVDLVGVERRVYMPPEVEYTLKFERTHRFDAFLTEFDWRLPRDMGLPNTTLMDGIPSANNFDPILPRRYTVWVQAMERLPERRLKKVLSSVGVGWLAALDPDQRTGVRYEKVAGSRRVSWIPEAVGVGSSREALEASMAPGFQPSQVVILEADLDPNPVRRPGEGEVRMVESADPGKVRIEVESQSAGWVLLRDAWYPGWRARVDGEDVEVFQANYLFQAVKVPGGNHRVEFYYRPMTFWVGAAVSLLAWLLWAGMVWRCRSG